MKKCAIVYNPESGKASDKRDIKSLPDLLEINGYETMLCPTKGPKDAINIVRELDDDIDLVICAGGDGTLNEGITGDLQRKNKLLISQIPVGTVNDVGTMYGYTKNMKVNTQMLLSGTKKNVDVCLINNNPFVYVACIGSYVDVSYNTPRNLKKKYGRLGYLFNALSEFNKDSVKQFDLTYEVDGIKKSGTYSFIFITNTNRMGGIFNIYDDIKLDDDMFEVVLCSVKNKAELIKVGTTVLTTKIKNMPGIEYFKTNNFKVTFDKVPPSWVIDGEEYKHKEKEFKFSINKEINMLVPSKNVVKLFSNLEELEERK